MNKILIIAILFYLGSTCVNAQQGYRLTGKVTDSSTGEALPGANIIIEGQGKGTITKFDGTFELSNIQTDKVSLNVTFLGYDMQRVYYQFFPEGKNELKIRLNPSSISLGQVQVTAESQGETKAFMTQKNAANIKNVVSSEQIEKFPDLNAAEAMQRIPGITLQRDQGEGKYIQLRGTPPELTNFNINGEQIPSPEGGIRYVGMDIISADQIEQIEISKVLTPDMDADAIGGSVNIVTKKARSENPEIDVAASLGYNALRGTQNGNLQFAYGQRYKKFGFQMNASYYVNNQGSDGLEFDYAKGPFWGDTISGKDNYFLQYQEFQLRHYQTQRKRTGLSATLDYQFNTNHSVYLRAMYNNFIDDQVRRRKIYGLEDAVNINNYLYGSVEHDVKARTQNQTLSTINIGGEHIWTFLEADYEISYSDANEDVPNRLEAAFENPGQALQIKISRTNPDYPVALFSDPVEEAIATNYLNYEFDRLLLKSSWVDDRNISGKLNFKFPFQTNSLGKGYFKIGGKVRLKQKERDVTAQSFKKYRMDWNQYPSSDHGPELTLVAVNDGFSESNLLDQGYLMDFMPSHLKMREFYNFYPHLFIYGEKGSTESKKESNVADFYASERIYSYYAMFRHDYEKLMVIGGVRFDGTNISYEGKTMKTSQTFYFDTLYNSYDNRKFHFLLPQIQFKYSFANQWNIRGAITPSFSRPNFDDILPYKEQDRDEITFGNPDLNYAESINYDFLIEKYLSGNGIVSGGIYFKKIDNFISDYAILGHLDTIVNSLVEIKTAINGKKAFVYGAEFQYQSKFSLFKSFLKDFGIYSNYSFTFSEAYIGERLPANYSDLVVKVEEDGVNVLMNDSKREKISLPGQAKHALNLALFYETARFYARLSANYHDKFLNSLGADKDLDEFEAAAWHLDFTASYSINKNLRFFVDAINITNAPQTFYLGSTQFIKKQEYYSWWGRLGIKLNF